MKRYLIVFILSVLFQYNACANIPGAPTDTNGIYLLKTEIILQSKAMDVLNTLCDIYGPKPSFSPALVNTSSWLSGYMKEVGLQNIHQEVWLPKGRSWEIKAFEAHVTSPYYLNLIAYPRMYSTPTQGILRTNAINLIINQESDLDSYKGKLKGKIVFLGPDIKVNLSTRPFVNRMADSTLARLENIQVPTSEEKQKAAKTTKVNDSLTMLYLAFQSKIIEFCGKEGAAMMIDGGNRTYGTVQVWSAISTEVGKDLFDWSSKAAFYSANVPLPQVTISAEQFNSIVRVLKTGEPVSMEVNLDVKTRNGVEEKNLIAEIPGTDLKDEVVMIGAHLDGYQVGSNAIDNNVGVVACLETMRAIKKLGTHPRRTIRIALWTGEEQGCLGSKAYVEKHFIPGDKEKLQAYFNMDNGAGRFRGINAEESPFAKQIFKSWMQLINDPKFQTVSLQRVDHTDHWAFTEVGLPGFQFIQDPLDYYRTYHTNMDVPERIPVEDFKMDAFYLTAFTWFAANMDGPIQEKMK